jgi:cellobiose transport system permease protein
LPKSPAPVRSAWRQRLSRWDSKASPYAFVSPFLLLFLGFGIFPLVYTAYMSLYNYRLGGTKTWAGLGNFTWLFQDTFFWNALKNTVTMGVISTVPQLLMALGLAHILNYQLRARNFYRVSMLMPYATSVAAATLVFSQLFGRDYGLINWMLSLVGINHIDWQNGSWTGQVAIAIIVTWRWTGYNALIYLAGMQSIPQDLYEAAAIDGANRWRQFVNVTLPGLRPTILFTIVVSTIGATQLFGEPYLFSGGGQAAYNGGASHQYQTLSLYMYQQGWQYLQLGRAAAVAWTTLVIVIIFVAVNLSLASLRNRTPKLRTPAAGTEVAR